jgi:hypothetical protein
MFKEMKRKMRVTCRKGRREAPAAAAAAAGTVGAPQG